MSVLLAAEKLDQLVGELVADGHHVLGPVVSDGVITYSDITGVADLPRGWRDEQGPGHYRLRPDGEAFFDWVPAQASWKQTLFPALEPLWDAELSNGAIRFKARVPAPPPTAIIGARGCELAAIAVQDKVFLDGLASEPRYAARREALFIVAVECGRAVSTCFCPSMGTGPAIDDDGGADIVLTELPGAGFVARGVTERGQGLLDRLDAPEATTADMAAAAERVAATAASITRTLDTETIRADLRSAIDAEVWGDLEQRCLACGNCTAVCPTCFCSSTVDTSALDGSAAARDRIWASCFTFDYSYMASHTVRTSVGSRYRQWITHKLSTWVDQFGTLGCVGCGRCITWCPVGIDIVAEATKIQDRELQHA